MGGGGSIQDMNNRIRDNRALLGRRKIRFRSGKRFFDEKPVLMTNKGKKGNTGKPSESQLEAIRIKLKREARFNQIAVNLMFMFCILILACVLYKILT
jgi:hypothetical protein